MDSQLSMDLGVSAEPTEWDKWVDQGRHKAQARKILDRAGLPALPPEPWDFEKEESLRLNGAVDEILPDFQAVSLPGNADIVDQVACLAGAWFVQYLDARWIDLTKFPRGYNDSKQVSVYDRINPGLSFKFDGWTTFTANLLVEFIVENEFLDIIELTSVGFWRLRKDDTPRFADLSTSFPDHPPFV